MAIIDDIFYKYKHGNMDVGFRWHADSFQCEESAFGEVKFIWMSSSNTEFTIEMLTDLHIPRIRWSGYNISQSGCLNYTDTQVDSVSGREITRTYKVKFRAEFELQSDKNLHVVQFRRVPEESETTKRWVFEDYNEGMMYLTGDGFTADFEKAKELFREAADQGHPGAQKMLQELKLASPEDYLKDMREARRGNATAQLNMGLAYHNGTGVTKDFVKAAEWFRRSAEQGNQYSQSNLGNLYAQGFGVEKDEAKALEWWEKAAAQGHGQACYNIGRYHQNGTVVPQDKNKAKEYYVKAIECGYENAKKNYEEVAGKPYVPPKPKTTSSSSSGYNESFLEKLAEALGFQWWEDELPVILAIILALVMTAGATVLAMAFIPKWWIAAAIGVLVLSFCALRWRNTVLIVVFSLLAVGGGIMYYFSPPALLEQVAESLLGKTFATANEPAAATAAITSGVNFRSGPSTNDAVIRQLKQGDNVTLTGEERGGWVQVSHDGDTGWVSSEFVRK